MPYLADSRKRELESEKVLPTTAGDLTFLLTLVLLEAELMRPEEGYARIYKGFDRTIRMFCSGRELRYADFATILGCVECASLEYVRRRDYRFRDKIRDYITKFYIVKVAPYEDKKIEENGDCY